MTVAYQQETIYRDRSRVIRATEKGVADTALTTTVPIVAPTRLSHITVKYSGVPVQAGVTITLDSGAGADYDAVLLTGDANAQTTVLIPTDDLLLVSGDAIVVVAPAGGGVLTAATAIYLEENGG